MSGLSPLSNRLELKIVVFILTFLIFGFGTIYFLFSERIENYAVAQTRQQLEMLSASLHTTVDRSMVNFRADIARHIVDDLKHLKQLARVQIIRGKTGNGAEQAFQDLVTLEDVKTRVPGGLRPEWLADHANRKENVAEGVDTPEFKNAFQKYLNAPEGDTYYFETVGGTRMMTYLKPLPNFERCFLCHGSDHKLRGVLMISTSMDVTHADIAEQKKNLFVISLGTLLTTGFLLRFSISRFIVNPVRKVSDRIQDISEGEGDLSKRLEVGSGDEIGNLAKGFNVFAEKLSKLISQVVSTSAKVSSTSSQVMTGTMEIMEGAEIQINATEATALSIEQMNRSIQNVAKTSGALATASRESTDTVHEITTAISEMAKSMSVLNTSVEETATSILKMSSSFKTVDQNVETLVEETKATTMFMQQMDRSLKTMRDNIIETVDLSHEVNVNAETGKKTVEMTMDGMHRIKDYSHDMSVAIRNLQQQTENIGKFLNVIDEVADQTNLLALNAAIIAAQAGEHGKGFSVVAGEIKELADRTASSTREIHEIVKALQSESKVAVNAIEVGDSRVEEGVDLSVSAHNALTKIVDSINRSTERTSLLADVIEEQSKGVKKVTTSMEQVNQIVVQIARTTGDQSAGSEYITQATSRMKEITRDLQSMTQAHSASMKKVKETLQEGCDQAQMIADATSDQKTKSEEIIHSISQIKKVTHETVDSIGKMGFEVEELRRQTKRLEEDIARFKL